MVVENLYSVNTPPTSTDSNDSQNFKLIAGVTGGVGLLLIVAVSVTAALVIR